MLTARTMSQPYHNQYFADRRQNKYAIVLFLPQQLNAIIAPLREKFDPIYQLVDSHVTIVFPFESSARPDQLATIIKAETDNQTPVEIKLNALGDFYPRHPIIYLGTCENECLSRLYYRLSAGLGLTPPHKEYTPHVTIAREISAHRVMLVKEELVSYIPEERFVAERIDLITTLSDDRWVSVRTFPLMGRE